MLYLINCGRFNLFRVYSVLDPQARLKSKQFLLLVVRGWVTDDSEVSLEPETNLSSFSPGVQGEHLHKDPHRRRSRDTMQHEPTPIPVSGKKAFLMRACRICAAHGKRSESRYLPKFYLVPLHRGKHFTKYHALKKVPGT